MTRLLTQMVGTSFSDILTGYSVFSRRFVLPAGFEIQTEISIHALELAMPCAELPTACSDRPTGSVPKLWTYAGG